MFEAVFAYSRDKKVITVGMLGIDLNNVRPPLSLLQDFNVTAALSLSNIVSMISNEFQYKFEERVSEEEFSFCVENTKLKGHSYFCSCESMVNTIKYEYSLQTLTPNVFSNNGLPFMTVTKR